MLLFKRIMFALVTIGLASSVSKSQVVKPTHPRIFLDPAIITNLQNRATANTIEWQEIETRIAGVSSYSADDIMSVVYEGQQYAFYYALSYFATGNTAHRDTAVNIFQAYFNDYTTDSSMYWDSGFESRSTMADVATLYDWLYNDMSVVFRNNVRARLVIWADFILTQPSSYGMWGTPYFFEGNNYSMGHLYGITACGYAIQSEDALKGDEFIAVCDSVLPAMLNFVNTRLAGGDANEGWGYGAGYAVNFFKTLATVKTATTAGTNYFASTTYDEGCMKFLPTATLPNLDHMLAEGDWARESSGELWDFHRLTSDIISTYSNDPTTQQVALFWGNETVPISNFAVTAYRWFPFLFSNVEVSPVDYRTLPAYSSMTLYTDTTGTDQFIRRTGWGATDQWVSYRGGARYGDHAHNGSGHFSVYENGWLIIDKNIQSLSGIEGSDSMHNCMHFSVMNNDELYPFEDNYNLAEHTLGKRRDLNTEYSYLWTNATPIYAARNSYFNVVENSERQFFYIPGIKKLAVYDVAETNSATYNNWFGLNYTGTALISSDSSYTYYSNGITTAYVHTCYPLTKTVSAVGQLVRVGNKVNQQKDMFMHLVSTQPDASPVLNVLAVNQENNRLLYGDFYGSFHEDVVKNYCILFADDDAGFNYDSLSFEVPATQILHTYVTGLIPSATYYVSFVFPAAGIIRVKVSLINETSSVPYIASTGGVLSFEITDLNSLHDLNSFSSFNIYYNEQTGNIVIGNNKNSDEAFTTALYSITGELIVSEKASPGRLQIVSVSGVASGIYLVKVVLNGNNFAKKVLIK